MMIFDLWMTKYADVIYRDRKAIFEFYSSMLWVRSLEDPYASSKNVIHSKEEIHNFLSATKPSTPIIAKKLGRLVNACYHLGHAMYSDMNPSIVYDNYGPYDTSEKYGYDHIIAVKEFGNLRSKELWPESFSLPYNLIRIVCVYKNVSMTVDIASHAIYQGDLINGLRYFSLKVDNREYPTAKLDKISEPIEKMAINIFQRFQALGFEEKKIKYYFTKAFVYKKLYDKLGQNWQPLKEILAEARDKKLHHVNWPKDKDKQKEIVRKILDPRIDFCY